MSRSGQHSVIKSPHKLSLFRRESNLKKVSHFLTYVTICGSLGYFRNKTYFFSELKEFAIVSFVNLYRLSFFNQTEWTKLGIAHSNFIRTELSLNWLLVVPL